jgi:hemerythrin-like domain-containing protein
MLTVTYSLVTLSVEQKKARDILSTLQQHIQGTVQELQNIDRHCWDSLFMQLTQFDASCHRRNVELYVIPAVRKVTREADSLLEELESLSRIGAEILQSIQARLHLPVKQDIVEIKAFCGLMEAYCRNLLTRLNKEESHLVPIAQRVISGDGWFDIAAQFISHDAENQRLMRYPSQPHGASLMQIDGQAGYPYQAAA